MAKLILDYCLNNNIVASNEETKLFELVKKHDKNVIEEALRESNDWNILYNLAPQRGNVLVPCAISKDDTCLEVGAECGALSSCILRYTKNLDCIELSKTKSEINYERNISHENLNIFVGNFQHISPKLAKKYDKIFFVGSFALAPLYMPESANPFINMLLEAKKLLKKDGEIFIAIENKYGMKYFNGAKEDHTGKAFESIEGYQSKDYKTFSNVQLRNMLKEVGLTDICFYYPLPDYKFANVIYSENYLPQIDGVTNVGHSLDRERAIIFNEDKALGEAASSEMFEVFANSFLVKAGF